MSATVRPLSTRWVTWYRDSYTQPLEVHTAPPECPECPECPASPFPPPHASQQIDQVKRVWDPQLSHCPEIVGCGRGALWRQRPRRCTTGCRRRGMTWHDSPEACACRGAPAVSLDRPTRPGPAPLLAGATHLVLAGPLAATGLAHDRHPTVVKRLLI